MVAHKRSLDGFGVGLVIRVAKMEQEPGKDGVTVSGVNLGELAKPATILIEKISEAIGGIARPWQIVRVARAESVAKRIEAEAEIEISKIQRRALRRFFSEEEQKQKNIEAITEKAIPSLADQADPNGMDKDWIADFFDKCRLVSDEEMQLLWSKLLAGEANKPGSCSKRTVGILASLSKQEAELFTLFGTLLWRNEHGSHYLLEADAVEKMAGPVRPLESVKHSIFRVSDCWVRAL